MANRRYQTLNWLIVDVVYIQLYKHNRVSVEILATGRELENARNNLTLHGVPCWQLRGYKKLDI
jgi:hypothetical protein